MPDAEHRDLAAAPAPRGPIFLGGHSAGLLTPPRVIPRPVESIADLTGQEANRAYAEALAWARHWEQRARMQEARAEKAEAEADRLARMWVYPIADDSSDDPAARIWVALTPAGPGETNESWHDTEAEAIAAVRRAAGPGGGAGAGAGGGG